MMLVAESEAFQVFFIIRTEPYPNGTIAMSSFVDSWSLVIGSRTADGESAKEDFVVKLKNYKIPEY